MKWWVFYGLLAMLLSGCLAFQSEDVMGTVEADTVLLATESVSIEQTLQAERQAVEMMVIAQEGTVAFVNAVNRELVGTLASVVTPTPQVSGAVIEINATQAAEFEGRRLFFKTGMSAQVDGAGCVIDPNIRFILGEVSEIYATAKVFNIESGVELSSAWYYAGELVYTTAFTTNRAFDEWCYWFNITPNDTEFKPGTWSVRLFADGFQLEEAMPFTLVSQ